jgi:hypothetical protein
VKKDSKNKIWFPSKSYGWGWGLPHVWQGWVALIGSMTIGAAPLVYLTAAYKGDTYCKEVLSKGINATCNPDGATPVYLIAALLWLFAWILILVQIAMSKGEKPTWRWGAKKKATTKHATKSKLN